MTNATNTRKDLYDALNMIRRRRGIPPCAFGHATAAQLRAAIEAEMLALQAA